MSRIIIDIERCKGCYMCIDVCPRNCIEPGVLPNAAGYYPARPTENGECTACTLCATVCPDVAITVWRSVGDAEVAVSTQQVAG